MCNHTQLCCENGDEAFVAEEMSFKDLDFRTVDIKKQDKVLPIRLWYQ
jgi:hypothetical protein